MNGQSRIEWFLMKQRHLGNTESFKNFVVEGWKMWERNDRVRWKNKVHSSRKRDVKSFSFNCLFLLDEKKHQITCKQGKEKEKN